MDAGSKGVLWYGLRVLGDALLGVSLLVLVFHLAGRFPGGLWVAAVGAALGALALFAARTAGPPA